MIYDAQVKLRERRAGGGIGLFGALVGLATLCTPAMAQADEEAYWVYLQDRPQARDRVDLSERTRARRSKRHIGFDARDRPVEPAYVDALAAQGVTIRHESRWLNAVSVDADEAAIAAIRTLGFVREVRPVATGARRAVAPRSAADEDDPPIEGNTTQFLEAIGAHYLHGCGLTGDGVLVGVLDTGFAVTHEAMQGATIVGERDFVDGDDIVGVQEGDPGSAHWHGTAVLSTIAGNLGDYIGVAPGASFLLAKTEDVSLEEPIEEDHYVAGLEWIEAEGADLATASLGYIDWYTQDDLDGQTAVTTIAVNIAVEKGLIVLSAAGNNGPEPRTLIAPADSPAAITVGALTKQLTLANFSSRGPTADDRQKPEVTAPGVRVVCADPDNDAAYIEASGTSLATPLVAGLTALLLEAYPNTTAEEMKDLLYTTASLADAPTPGEGFGLVGGQAAGLLFCSCMDVDDDGDLDTECGGSDCDDGDPEVGPGKDEVCDGKDSNCDGVLPPEEQDGDGDGFIPCAGDCNDANGEIYPTADENCGNGIDDDCDDLVDLEDPECEPEVGEDGGTGSDGGVADTGDGEGEGTGGDTTSGAGADEDGAAGCSCAATGARGAVLWMLPGLLFMRRRTWQQM